MSITRGWKRVVVIAATVTGLVAGVTTVAMPSASAAVSLRQGYGMNVRGHWFGSYINGGRIMYCVSPEAGLSQGQTVSTVDSWSHIGKVKSEEVEYILNRYGDTKSKTQAAAVYDALNQVVGNNAKAFSSWERRAPAAVRKAAKTMMSNAQLYRGTYQVTVKVTKQALVGQAGTINVTLTSGTGHGVWGSIALSATNATIASTVKVGSSGTAAINFMRTGSGTVKIYARGTNLPPMAMVLSHPAKGQQELLSFRPSVNTGAASASFQKTVANGSVQYDCSTACNGKPPLSYTWCHAANEATRKYQVLDNGKVVKTVEIKQSSKSSCVTATVVIPDTNKVSATCSYYVNGKWSSAVSCGPTVVVDCPPWPVVTETLSCDCTNGSIILSLAKNTTTHVEAINYSVNGGKQVQQTANPGDTLSVKIPFDRTSDTDVVFNGAVQRSDGNWNVGGDEEVIVRKI